VDVRTVSLEPGGVSDESGFDPANPSDSRRAAARGGRSAWRPVSRSGGRSSLQPDTLPLFASLLSLPQPADASPITLSPQKQKEKTRAALVAWTIEEAEKAPVYYVWEDLHWADPSSLEGFPLLLDQLPTTRVLAVLTFRPDFRPPWPPRSHIAQLMLAR
jgi:hypothetical protein